MRGNEHPGGPTHVQRDFCGTYVGVLYRKENRAPIAPPTVLHDMSSLIEFSAAVLAAPTHRRGKKLCAAARKELVSIRYPAEDFKEPAEAGPQKTKDRYA